MHLVSSKGICPREIEERMILVFLQIVYSKQLKFQKEKLGEKLCTCSSHSLQIRPDEIMVRFGFNSSLGDCANVNIGYCPGQARKWN